MFDALVQDLKYGVRSLRGHPVFTAVAILSLALGIGGNTAMFSLVNTLLLTKLQVRDPDALYQLMVTHRSATHNAFSYTDYRKLQDGFRIFDGVIAWSSRNFEVHVKDAPVQVHGAVVTGSFYDVLGVKAAAGRLLTPEDDIPGASNIVLGYGFWQRMFNRNPDAIGRVIRVQSVPMTIVGVSDPQFGGAEIDHPRDIVLPVHAMKTLFPRSKMLEATGAYWMHVMVRLRPGMTMESARPVLRDVWPRLLEADGPPPVDGWKQKLDIAPGASGFSGLREFSVAVVILMILVALVLLIACANLANLLLGRATGRRKEIAVRLAIGARRARLLRQWLTESFLLAFLGACAGVLLARWITFGLLLFLPRGGSSFLAFHINGAVLLFTAAITVLTALLFGLLPALQATALPPASVLQEAGRSASSRRAILTRAVVVAQVAVCLVLVAGALLFARSLRNLSLSDYGFDRKGLLLAEFNPEKAGIRGERVAVFYTDLLNRLNATPGIQTASCAAIVPLSGGAWWDPAVVPGYIPAKDERTTVYLNAVAPGYFAAMGTRILQGREFTVADDSKSRRVAIVNESFARRFFPAGDALGHKFTVGPGDDPQTTNIEIVGIAANTKYARPDEPQKELVYVAMPQSDNFGGALVVRLSPGTSMTAASAAIRELIGNRIPVEISPYDKTFERALQQDRMLALLSGLFGFMGMLLACVGLYGVLSNAVNTRTGEIGVRMALGAGRASVLWMILRESMLLAVIGAAIGIPVALVSSRVIQSRLFGLTPGDPVALTLAALILLAVAMLAGYLPAYRASSVDPAAALRAE